MAQVSHECQINNEYKKEVKILARLKREKIDVPCVYFVDILQSSIYMEEIIGVSLKAFIKLRGSLDDRMGEEIGKVLYDMHRNSSYHLKS